MIRPAMFVTLIVLVSLIVEQEALELSFKKMLTGKSYSAEERSHAMQLMGQRAMNKIRANLHGSPIQRTKSPCDTSDINACMPTGPTVDLTADITLAKLKQFCQYAMTYAQCISDIDFDSCKGNKMTYPSYVGAANAALMYEALCPDETLTDVYNNIKCILQALDDESCEDAFDDQPNDNTGVCKDYVSYLQCKYDNTMKYCNNDETAANVVEEIVNIEWSSLFEQHGIDCTPKDKRPTKAEDMLASLVGSRTKADKRSQLLDLLDKLANKESA